MKPEFYMKKYGITEDEFFDADFMLIMREVSSIEDAIKIIIGRRQ